MSTTSATQVKSYEELSPKELYHLLLYTNDNLIILGPPGIGKTTIVIEVSKEVAKELGREWVDIADLADKLDELAALQKKMKKEGLTKAEKERMDELERSVGDVIEHPEKYFIFAYMRLGTVHSEDISGVPRTHTVFAGGTEIQYMREIHFPQLALLQKLLNKGGVEAWFVFDEVTEGVQSFISKASAVTALFGEKRMGASTRLPNTARIIGLGNPAGVTFMAEQLPDNIVGRASIVVVRPPTVEEWFEGLDKMREAFGREFVEPDPAVKAFLQTNPSLLFNMNNATIVEGTAKIYPTPRGWTNTGSSLRKIAMMKFKKNSIVDVLREADGSSKAMLLSVVETIAQGYVGVEAAQKLVAFLSVQTPDPIKLMEKGELEEWWTSATDIQQRIMLLVSLASKAEVALNNMKIVQSVDGKVTIKNYDKVRPIIKCMSKLLPIAGGLKDLLVNMIPRDLHGNLLVATTEAVEKGDVDQSILNDLGTVITIGFL